MKTLIVRLTAVAVFVAASLPAAAQQAPSVTPDAKAIIERHITAAGAKSLASITSMRATGSLSMPAQGITGTVELFGARPNKTLLKAEIAGIGKLESAFDGERGWTVDPIMGPSLLTGKQLDQARFDAAFDNTFADPARYTSLTAAGTATFDGRQVYRVDAVNAIGDKSTEYFDIQTGLHAGSTSTRETPMGTVEVTSFLRDYRKVGSGLQPHQMVQKMMGVEQIIVLDRIEFNTVPADAFAIPPAVKALIK